MKKAKETLTEVHAHKKIIVLYQSVKFWEILFWALKI
jgi:hypothetical protein